MLKRTATTDSPLAIRGRLPTKTRKIAKPKRDGPAPASDKYENLEQLAARIRVCPACPLCQSRTNAVPGEGKPNAKVMIIGEAPGANEDKTGRPFAGNAGRYLDHVLEGTGLERTDFFITNIVKCRPPSNRTPKNDEVETCTSLYLFKQIELLQPRLIVLLGSLAVKKILGLKSVEEARGRIVSHDGRDYLATYHPAVRFYREDLAAKIKVDFGLLKKEIAQRIVSRAKPNQALPTG